MKKGQPWAPNSHFTEQAAALREAVSARKVVALSLTCIVCLTGFTEVFWPYDGPIPTAEEQFEELLDRAAIQGWALVDYREKTETRRGLACGKCARIIRSPEPPPTRATSSVLLPPFEAKKRHGGRAA